MKSDYLKLARKGSKLTDNAANLPVVRLAVLSDNATQQLTNVLKGSLLEKGFYPEIYEAEFDTIATEVLDKKSALFSFNPAYVWLNISSQAYRNRFYNAKAGEVHQLPAFIGGAGEVGGVVLHQQPVFPQTVVAVLAVDRGAGLFADPDQRVRHPRHRTESVHEGLAVGQRNDRHQRSPAAAPGDHRRTTAIDALKRARTKQEAGDAFLKRRRIQTCCQWLTSWR